MIQPAQSSISRAKLLRDYDGQAYRLVVDGKAHAIKDQFRPSYADVKRAGVRRMRRRHPWMFLKIGEFVGRAFHRPSGCTPIETLVRWKR